jgi:sterol desaturase/sphingolipid hydroxylase (fatty acid hydroxylase superfamily)
MDLTTTGRPKRRRTVVATGALVAGAMVLRGPGLIAIVVLAACFVALERCFPLHRQPVLRRGWKTDVVHFLVNQFLTTAGVAAIVVVAWRPVHALVPDSWRTTIASFPAVLQFLIAVVVSELAQYWAHRAAHRFPLLWRFHRVHHSITTMDWLAAGHLHPLDQAVIRSAMVVPVVALGFSRATFGAYLAFVGVLAIAIHANVRVRFGPLRHVISTPEYHHWHHSKAPEAIDTNFGGFPLTDRLFGTLYLPADRRPEDYGTAMPEPDGYLAQLAWPFRY